LVPEKSARQEWHFSAAMYFRLNGQRRLATRHEVFGRKGAATVLPSASLELAAKDGRIQDILVLFAKSPRALMSGIVSRCTFFFAVAS
jgi:hypothetical protein